MGNYPTARRIQGFIRNFSQRLSLPSSKHCFMKQPLLGITVLFLLFTVSNQVQAQVQGDPPFPGVAAGTSISKNSSTLSPDLQRLAGTTTTTTTAKTKAVTALTKPLPPGVGEFTKY